MTTTAVVGAGLTGLLVANGLTSAGESVVIFDKGRGPGGRMATRRWERSDPLGPAFDHGALCCTPESDGFRRQVQEWVERGWMAPWNPRVQGGTSERFVAASSWGTFAREIAAGLDVQLGTRVHALRGHARNWTLHMDGGESAGPFERVIVTAPGPQAAALLAGHAGVGPRAQMVAAEPCWAAMVLFEQPVQTSLDWIESADPEAIVHSAVREASKPGRPQMPCWTLHGGANWSREGLERDQQVVLAELLGAFAAALGEALPGVEQARLHRWGYAHCRRMRGTDGEGAVWAQDTGLGLAGDGLGASGTGLESAWQSALALLTLLAD